LEEKERMIENASPSEVLDGEVSFRIELGVNLSYTLLDNHQTLWYVSFQL
jgi:hypothetical protein